MTRLRAELLVKAERPLKGLRYGLERFMEALARVMIYSRGDEATKQRLAGETLEISGRFEFYRLATIDRCKAYLKLVGPMQTGWILQLQQWLEASPVIAPNDEQAVKIWGQIEMGERCLARAKELLAENPVESALEANDRRISESRQQNAGGK